MGPMKKKIALVDSAWMSTWDFARGESQAYAWSMGEFAQGGDRYRSGAKNHSGEGDRRRQRSAYKP